MHHITYSSRWVGRGREGQNGARGGGMSDTGFGCRGVGAAALLSCCAPTYGGRAWRVRVMGQADGWVDGAVGGCWVGGLTERRSRRRHAMCDRSGDQNQCTNQMYICMCTRLLWSIASASSAPSYGQEWSHLLGRASTDHLRLAHPAVGLHPTRVGQRNSAKEGGLPL